MRKLTAFLLLSLAAACTSFERNPYAESLRKLAVEVVWPEEWADYRREGVGVTLSDRNTSNVYTASTDASGRAEFLVAAGHYRLSVLDKADASAVFNGTVELVDLAGGDVSLEMTLSYSRPGAILIKELYSGGCPADPPATGSNTYDKYLILHNNSAERVYLDGLCLCTVAPYNSKASSNPWTSTDASGNIVFRDYAAVPDCIWQFGGTGADFPLEAGEDAVVALLEAVDHTQTYSLSVNLNREGYFVCYDQLLYPGQKNRPITAPGDRIEASHHLRVLKKTGRSGENGANTYVVSQYSPAMIIFRAPEDFDLEGYMADDLESAILLSSITYSKVPWEWVLDGVEVSDNTGANNWKRLPLDIDAGSVGFSGTSLGHTVHRHVDETATTLSGYEVLQDTNNSSNDFYERETQSLREL